MPENVERRTEEETIAKEPRSSLSLTRPQLNWSLPAPVKRLFDRFPLLTYAINELPQRTLTSRETNCLYVFSNERGARLGRPSCNPGCLKWQVSTELRSRKASPAYLLCFSDLPTVQGSEISMRSLVQSCLAHRRLAILSTCSNKVGAIISDRIKQALDMGQKYESPGSQIREWTPWRYQT